MATAPSITQSGAFSSGTAASTYTFTGVAITAASDCLWLGVTSEASTTMSLQSVSSAGVTWKKVAEYSYALPSGETYYPGMYTVSLWAAPLGTQQTYPATNVTVTFNQKFDAIAGCMWGSVGDNVAGGCTLEPDLPVSADGLVTGTNPSITYSTRLSDDLLFMLLGTDNATGVGPANWTRIISAGTSNVREVLFFLYSQQTTLPVTNVTVNWGNSPVYEAIVIAGESGSPLSLGRSFYVTAGM